MNVDIFDEKLNSYYCGNIADTKKWLKSLSRANRALVVEWLYSTDTKSAHTWAIWIIEGL